jgi:hypothetical protein
VFLDLSNDMNAQVTVSGEVLYWLKKVLANYPKKMPLLVFSHYPLHPDAPRFGVLQADKLLNLLEGHKVIAYFSGHYHGRWCGFVKGIPFFTNVRLIPNISKNAPYPECGYYVVDVYESTVGVAIKNVFPLGSFPSHPADSGTPSGALAD